MSTWTIIGLVGGVGALLGAGFLAWRFFRNRREATKKKNEARPERVPSKPPPDSAPVPPDLTPHYDLLGVDQLSTEMADEITAKFGDRWPPDDPTFDRLEPDHMIVFAVESTPVGFFDRPCRELIVARVLQAGAGSIAARVLPGADFAHHHGVFAGHGLSAGTYVEVPRSKVLVAAEDKTPPRQGYDSRGRAVKVLTPTNRTPEVHHVNPGTVYDLLLPYRTNDLVWMVGEEMELIRVGQRGELEQVIFGESTARGRHTITVLDDDAEAGQVFVAAWSFEVAE